MVEPVQVERRKSMANLSSIDRADGKNEMSGYLHKRRGGYGKHMPNSWQLRYFIVRDGWMYYFEEKKLNARPRGKVDLQSELVTLVENIHFDNSPSPYTMLINPGGYEEKWKLCAADSDDMERWCRCIKEHINTKFKRKPAHLLIPAYNSDDEGEDDPITDDEGEAVVLDRLTAKDPHGEGATPRQRAPKSASEKKGTHSAAPTAPTFANSGGRKDKMKPSVKFRTSDNSDTAESILTLLLLNLCIAFASFSEKVIVKVFYFVVSNIVVAHTMYLRSNRVEKQSKELKALALAKEKADALVSKQATKLSILDAVAEVPTDINEVVEASVPRAPGTTIKQVFGVPTDEPGHTWSTCEDSGFNVRQGPNYRKFKKKTPSGPALYEPFAVDTFCSRKRIDNIAQHLNLASDMQEVETNHPSVPPIFIVQLQLPTDSPPLFGSVEDGPGWSVVMYFKITQDTCNQLKDLSSASPAVKLFATYCDNAEKDYAWRSRLKMIGCCSNLEELGVPGAIATYNAKPVMIRKTGSIYRGKSYLEVNINVHKWPTYVQKCIQYMYPNGTLMYLQVGFVIEGREDSELPETLLGCVGVNRPDEEQVGFFFPEDEIVEE